MADVVGATDIDPVDGGGYKTCVRAGLLGAWRKAAGDPDDQPEIWLREGAPAGIREAAKHRGVFPTVSDDMDDPELLGHQEYEAVSSKDGLDSDALKQFEEYEAKGYIRSFDTYNDLVSFLEGESPVLSEVMILTKLRGARSSAACFLIARRRACLAVCSEPSAHYYPRSRMRLRTPLSLATQVLNGSTGTISS